MKKNFKLDVYFVTDRDLSKGRPIENIVAAAVKGGATIIQLREKECSTREFIDIGNRVKKILAPFDVPLIINDRLDVALAIDADGIHIGQSDMPYEIARKYLLDKIIVNLLSNAFKFTSEGSIEVRVDLAEAAEAAVPQARVGPAPRSQTLTSSRVPPMAAHLGARRAARTSATRSAVGEGVPISGWRLRSEPARGSISACSKRWTSWKSRA